MPTTQNAIAAQITVASAMRTPCVRVSALRRVVKGRMMEDVRRKIKEMRTGNVI